LQLNRKQFDLKTITSWIGNGSATLVKRALSGSNNIDEDLDNELFLKAHKIFLEHYQQNVCVDTILFDGVKNTLSNLKQKGYILTIVTNKPYIFIQPILEQLKIMEYFDDFVGADSLDEKKPHPMPLLHMCNRFNQTVKSSVMIGDSKNDIIAAQNCSMDSIGVTYGYNYDQSIKQYNPTVIIDNIKDILKYL